MLALALVAGLYALQYNIFQQAIPHDTTFHIYAAQQILDGHALYRDVAIIKAPLSDFLTAAAMLGARLIGISDIMGARLLSLAAATATTAVTYLAGRTLFRSRAVGVLAGLVMAGWNFYGLRAVTGPEPKAFLILFGMLALVWVARREWGRAGAAAALTALAWQPGLMVAAIALAAALVAPWLTSGPFPDRPRRAVGNAARLLAGFAVPFLFVLFYLGAYDALRAAFDATIGANVNHFNNARAQTPLPQILRENFAEILSEGAQYCFSPREYWLVGGALLGLAGIALSALADAVRHRRLPLDLHRVPLLLYTLGFAGFALVDFDFCPDLFPLLPALALGVAWLIWTAARGAGRGTELFSRAARARPVTLALAAGAAALLVWIYLLDVWGYRVTGVNFGDQLAVAEAAKKYLAPGDRVLSFGDAIVPVELHLPNAHKILHLGSKSGIGILASEPGGMQGMIAALDHDAPRLITLSRVNILPGTRPFYDWVNARYDPAENFPRANIQLYVLRP